MKYKRLSIILGLQLYAFLLALMQLQGGVRTDEAKYLLGIPYPHPPLGRFLMQLTESWSFQEAFWRVVLASLLVQAMWLVWSMGKSLPMRDRLVACGVWLFSAGLVFQAGSIMMAPITAVQGLIFTWLYIRRDIDTTRFGGWIAILWGLSLFTAFQALLYLPLIIALFRRSRLPRWFQVFCIAAPILLLMLYVLGQPLLAASMILVQSDNALVSPLGRLTGVIVLWGIAASVWGSILGLGGILMKHTPALFWTLVLLSMYALLSTHDYYAILFLPLFIAGLTVTLHRYPLHPAIVLTPIVIGTLLLFPHTRPSNVPDPARVISQALAERFTSGTILIAGPFGHQWQYESSLSIRHYRSEFLKDAQAVVCIEECPEVQADKNWMPMRGVPIEVWVKR